MKQGLMLQTEGILLIVKSHLEFDDHTVGKNTSQMGKAIVASPDFWPENAIKGIRVPGRQHIRKFAVE